MTDKINIDQMPNGQKRIVVLGAGESGVGAAILAQQKVMMYLFLILEKLKIILKRN
ncbi:MAG: hypothetical protein R2728_13300 [Chitinophagales bacterium]